MTKNNNKNTIKFWLVLAGVILVIALAKNVLQNLNLPTSQVKQQTTQETKSIEISGVKMRDFNELAVHIGKLNDVLFVFTQAYNITYYPIDNAFLIIITSPFDEFRQEAETTFLDTLEINEEDACKLTVYITTPRLYNPDQSGKNYRLSFCE